MTPFPRSRRVGLGPSLIAVAAALLFAAGLLLPDYARPPIASEETGFRGTGMVDVANPREDVALLALNVVPPPELERSTEPGQLASEVYENVQVLGDLTEENFTRLMVQITAWVSPEQGCNYCHVENLADDYPYTKRVARWMIQMTRTINNDWKQHVGNTGVTCLTCHRGQPVPQYIWFEPETTGVATGSNAVLGYYKALYGHSAEAGDTSLAMDPYGPYLNSTNEESERIRVNSTSALPDGNRASTKQTEQTYALMMHMSNALGVNCTWCHNSRQFSSWEQSPPARLTAWFGIRMVRTINVDWMNSVASVFPANRLGPLGDVPKVNCTTCHQGLAKPLNGAQMLPDYPELAQANTVSAAQILPGVLRPMWEPAPEAPPEPEATPAPQPTSAPAPAGSQPPASAAPPEPATNAPAPAGPEAVPAPVQ